MLKSKVVQTYRLEELNKQIQLCWKLIEGTKETPTSWWEVSNNKWWEVSANSQTYEWKVFLRNKKKHEYLENPFQEGFDNSWQARRWVDMSQGLLPGDWHILHHWVTPDKKYILRKDHNSRKWDIQDLQHPRPWNFKAQDFLNRQEALDWLNVQI